MNNYLLSRNFWFLRETWSFSSMLDALEMRVSHSLSSVCKARGRKCENSTRGRTLKDKTKKRQAAFQIHPKCHLLSNISTNCVIKMHYFVLFYLYYYLVLVSGLWIVMGSPNRSIRDFCPMLPTGGFPQSCWMQAIFRLIYVYILQ